jgi:hypothetical protein
LFFINFYIEFVAEINGEINAIADWDEAKVIIPGYEAAIDR